MIDVKGMTIEQIMDLSAEDLSKMSASEMKAVTQRLASAGNKRIARLERARSTYGGRKGLASQSPAYRALEGEGGEIRKFSTSRRVLGYDRASAKGKLWAEFVRARKFLRAESSTTKGTRKMVRRIEERTGIKFKNKAQARRFWKAYAKVIGKYGDMIGRKTEEGRLTSDQVQAMLMERMYPKGNKPKKSPEAVESVAKELEERYEKEAEKGGRGVSPIRIVYEKIFPFGDK